MSAEAIKQAIQMKPNMINNQNCFRILLIILTIFIFCSYIKNFYVINAEGKIVTPGFIDIHSHADCTIPFDPKTVSTIHQLLLRIPEC